MRGMWMTKLTTNVKAVGPTQVNRRYGPYSASH